MAGIGTAALVGGAIQGIATLLDRDWETQAQ